MAVKNLHTYFIIRTCPRTKLAEFPVLDEGATTVAVFRLGNI